MSVRGEQAHPVKARWAAVRSWAGLARRVEPLPRLVSGLFKSPAKEKAPEPAALLLQLCHRLLEGGGIASRPAIAAEIARQYALLDLIDRTAFFIGLADGFGPDWTQAKTSWAEHEALPSRSAFKRLMAALEPPRQELFRRINGTPGGTAALVRMRADLLDLMRTNPGLDVVEDDLSHLLQSWFNIGFLTLKAIDWTTSADVLERVIRYEAVHPIDDWSDLRRRLLPPDRLCYGFFHPAMPDEPLIFIEVALTMGIPGSIQTLLAQDRDIVSATTATTAVFYSISNCQAGLHGISFGDLLIKAVAATLSGIFPKLKTFVTLSPLPGFRTWLSTSAAPELAKKVLTGADLENTDLKAMLMPMAARYLVDTRDGRGRPVDPVARFHLGNGASVHRLCWAGNTSTKGMAESYGVMVNYLYDLKRGDGAPAAVLDRTSVKMSKEIRQLARVIV